MFIIIISFNLVASSASLAAQVTLLYLIKFNIMDSTIDNTLVQLYCSSMGVFTHLVSGSLVHGS